MRELCKKAWDIEVDGELGKGVERTVVVVWWKVACVYCGTQRVELFIISALLLYERSQEWFLCLSDVICGGPLMCSLLYGYGPWLCLYVVERTKMNEINRQTASNKKIITTVCVASSGQQPRGTSITSRSDAEGLLHFLQRRCVQERLVIKYNRVDLYMVCKIGKRN